MMMARLACSHHHVHHYSFRSKKTLSNFHRKCWLNYLRRQHARPDVLSTFSTTSYSSSKASSWHVYSLGDGWTGATGTGDLSKDISGHDVDWQFDDDGGGYNNDDEMGPCRVFTALQKDGASIISASAGWGHSAWIVKEKNNGKTHLYMCGRPYELASLLRLRRLPAFLRRWLVTSSSFSESSSKLFSSKEEEEGDDSKQLNEEKQKQHWAGSTIGWMWTQTIPLITNKNTGTKKDTKRDQSTEDMYHDWDQASKYSFMARPTQISNIPPDETLVDVIASAAMTALLTREGNIYMMGINTYGQCGLVRDEKTKRDKEKLTIYNWNRISTRYDNDDVAQPPHFVQIALGFSHGLGLSRDGRVYAWGKGDRGQLGIANLSILSDKNQNNDTFTSVAHPIPSPLPTNVVQIASGMHHGAALTSDDTVWIWGKHMTITTDDNDDDDDKVVAVGDVDTAPKDLVRPIQLESPWNDDNNGDKKKILAITCGSHHTSILLQDQSVWSCGLSFDNPRVLHPQPICLILPAEKDTITASVAQFQGHGDRTTVIWNTTTTATTTQEEEEESSSSASQHVENVSLSQDSKCLVKHEIGDDDDDNDVEDVVLSWTPTWTSHLEKPSTKIQGVYRGWLHSLIVVKEES